MKKKAFLSILLTKVGIKQLYKDNLRKLPNENGDVSVMGYIQFDFVISQSGVFIVHTGLFQDFINNNLLLSKT